MTWVRPDEAAAALRVTVRHVRVLAHRDRWRKRRIGRRVWYHLDDVADTEARRTDEQAGQTTVV